MSLLVFTLWLTLWLLATYYAIRYFRVQRKPNGNTWLGTHLEREAFYTYTDDPKNTDQKTINTLLMRRAMQDILRIRKLAKVCLSVGRGEGVGGRRGMSE